MSSFLLRHRTIIIVALVAVIILLSVLTLRTNVAATESVVQNSPQASQIVRNHTIEGLQLQYRVEPQDGDNYWVFYDYPKASASDVRTAASAMNLAATKLATTGVKFSATLVFARPFSIDEFKAFVLNTGITPLGSEIRALDQKGNLLKLHVSPVWARNEQGFPIIGQPVSNAQPLDTNWLDREQQAPRSLNIKGVIGTEVSLNGNTLAKIRQDSRVYAVDVTMHELAQEVKKIYPNAQDSKIQVGSSYLYTAMENTGIAPKS